MIVLWNSGPQPLGRPRTGTSLPPVRSRAGQLEVSSGPVSKASSVAPHSLHYCLKPEPLPPSLHPWKIFLHETDPWYQKDWGPLLEKGEIRELRGEQMPRQN